MIEYSIRKGRKEDIPEVLDLIRELAIYEKAEDEVDVTVESMVEDAFGMNPVYGFYVAVKQHEIIGLALYYYRYSTWKGKRLYLEDFVVRERYRGIGAGKMLFHEVIRHAVENDCKGISWQVLEWNKTAISFYDQYDTAYDGEWLNCSISTEDLRKLYIRI